MRGPGELAHHRLPVVLPSRRRRRRRQRLGITALALVTAAALAVTYGLGGSAAPRHDPGRRLSGHHGARSARAARQAPPTTTLPPTTTTTTSPGTLPQTTALPSATSPQFDAAMADLWQGVVTGNANLALPAFFPVGAYRQLKAITNPQQDWQDRLVATFILDVAAAHNLLGAGAGTAQLVRVNVPGQYAHWVTPGVCYNTIGYYEVPNARVVYREGGAVRSFGIASMISWRGQWYVVHLGAVLRTTTHQGLVDDPATGPGTSGYSSTC